MDVYVENQNHERSLAGADVNRRFARILSAAAPSSLQDSSKRSPAGADTSGSAATDRVEPGAGVDHTGPSGRCTRGQPQRRKPPSVLMTWPVIQAASSVDSQAMRRAGSSGSPQRPAGKRRRTDSRASAEA
ncbi:hypothetical protein Actkin_05074 [Actinokineospora sp. UTMC 2448]|nr:hypothetical protein Actkin_05074 [Actinokineospora sp. UTMC 2448]